ncbi:MAG: dTDP-4-amino-4,6-dideoxy-D-galactose acyltransferase [Limisphaerales bacterium]|jgi:dTDP-4-amino-4,6-dideoxy-D-galactose acyltransferase
MTESIQYLPFDSELFGFKVGRLNPGQLAKTDLTELLSEAKKAGFKVLYWNTTEDKQSSAVEAGGFLADRKRTYVRDTTSFGYFDLLGNWFISSYKEDSSNADLIELAYGSGKHSRFLKDPKFGRANFEKLYALWMEKSVSREIANEVLYIEDFGKIRAMLTLGVKNNRPDIGLVATSESYRGRGMAGDLIKSSIVWGINRGYKEVQVVTQGENKGACALYESYGYKLESEEFVFHFWL